jgi:hypothetical protein
MAWNSGSALAQDVSSGAEQHLQSMLCAQHRRCDCCMVEWNRTARVVGMVLL